MVQKSQVQEKLMVLIIIRIIYNQKKLYFYLHQLKMEVLLLVIMKSLKVYFVHIIDRLLKDCYYNIFRLGLNVYLIIIDNKLP